MRTNEIKNEIDEIRKWEEKIKRKDLIIDGAEMDQRNLLENMVKFNNKSKTKTKEGKAKKQNTFDSVNTPYEGRELTLNAFRSGIFPIKATQGKGLKILTPKQVLQRLPIAIAQVKADNTFENLLNEIRQIIYSLYQAKEITKKVYNIIMNSIKL